MHTDDNDLEDKVIVKVEEAVVSGVAVSCGGGRRLVEHTQVEVLQHSLAQLLYPSRGQATAKVKVITVALDWGILLNFSFFEIFAKHHASSTIC